jgi:hypothetical protein
MSHRHKEEAMSKEWTQQYLRECMADEAALAPLLTKWRNRRFTVPSSGLTLTSTLLPAAARGRPMTSPGASRLTFSAPAPSLPPAWRRNWEAAGDLSVDLGLTVSHDPEDGSVSVGAGGRRRNVSELYEDHPSKAAATWTAIVRAAVQLLESQGGH